MVFAESPLAHPPRGLLDATHPHPAAIHSLSGGSQPQPRPKAAPLAAFILAGVAALVTEPTAERRWYAQGCRGEQGSSRPE